MKRAIKAVLNGICLVVAWPAGAMCWLEAQWSEHGDAVFGFWTNVFALLPGRPGMYLRRAFYRLTLDSCVADWYIGFGAMFTHRQVRVEKNVYVGPYAMVGSAWLKRGTLIGTRASILSGTRLHEMDEQGRWAGADLSEMRQTVLGEHAWIGEGAIVMVDVGAGSMVGAGAVVSQQVRPGVLVAGNPARLVRRIRPEASEADLSSDAAETSDIR